MRFSILMVEDNPDDVELMKEMVGELEGDFMHPVIIRLTTVESITKALRMPAAEFDAILLDLTLPDSTGLDTVQRMLAVAETTPIVVLSGVQDEELAMRAVKQGAQDYLVKGQINGALLVRSLRYAMERFTILREKQRLIADLQEALGKIKTLKGLLPICAGCKKIRNDQGYWEQIESYVKEHSEADFTHGLCPECRGRYFPPRR